MDESLRIKQSAFLTFVNFPLKKSDSSSIMRSISQNYKEKMLPTLTRSLLLSLLSHNFTPKSSLTSHTVLHLQKSRLHKLHVYYKRIYLFQFVQICQVGTYENCRCSRESCGWWYLLVMITLIQQIPQEKRSAWKPDIVLTTAKTTLPPALRDLIILKGLENLLAMPFQF